MNRALVVGLWPDEVLAKLGTDHDMVHRQIQAVTGVMDVCVIGAIGKETLERWTLPDDQVWHAGPPPRHSKR